jgi:hypothetical protein
MVIPIWPWQLHAARLPTENHEALGLFRMLPGENSDTYDRFPGHPPSYIRAAASLGTADRAPVTVNWIHLTDVPLVARAVSPPSPSLTASAVTLRCAQTEDRKKPRIALFTQSGSSWTIQCVALE